jgi:hypothetical protein
MKLICCLFLLIIAYACRPHYDFSKLRNEIKNEVKSDSLVYQTGFEANDSSWFYCKDPNAGPVAAGGDLILGVDAVNQILDDRSPCGSVHYAYSVFTKVKISVEDSTNLGYAGIRFDRINENYHRTLYISNKGTFFLKDVYSGEEEILIPKISSRYLNKGTNAFNTIEIRHRKKEIRILFNGSLAAVCKINSAFSYGEIGLVASTTENKVHYSPVKAVFEGFVLKKMKEIR